MNRKLYAETVIDNNARLHALNSELAAALKRALRQVEFTHLYEQRLMTAGEAQEVAATLASMRRALAKAKAME